MTIRTAELDPEAIQRSIIYLKEKLECASESFEGSAFYNLQRALSFSNWLAVLLPVIICLLIFSIMIERDFVSVVIDAFVLSISVITFVIIGVLRYRDYNLCWFAHADAALKMQFIEQKLLFMEKEKDITVDNMKQFYDEYRSIYNETTSKLNNSKR